MCEQTKFFGDPIVFLVKWRMRFRTRLISRATSYLARPDSQTYHLSSKTEFCRDSNRTQFCKGQHLARFKNHPFLPRLILARPLFSQLLSQVYILDFKWAKCQMQHVIFKRMYRLLYRSPYLLRSKLTYKYCSTPNFFRTLDRCNQGNILLYLGRSIH